MGFDAHFQITELNVDFLLDAEARLLTDLDGEDYGACQNGRDDDLSDTRFEDAEMPPAGQGFFYLVRARDLICPATGTWGRRSDGAERVNTNPSACP